MAILSDGPPVLLNVAQAPTFADAQAAITWSSGVTVGLKTDFKMKNLIGRGSGESIQMAFSGQGWALDPALRGPRRPGDRRLVRRRRAREPAQRLRRQTWTTSSSASGSSTVCSHAGHHQRASSAVPHAACRSGSPPPALRAPQSASSRSAPAELAA